MQRLHEDDLAGFLLNGGSGEDWEHLCLPALDKDNNPLYPEKHTFEELELIRQADKYTFSGQYMQTPSPSEGGEWRKSWFNIVSKQSLNPNIKWELLIDGAYTKDTKNDPTGLQIVGKLGNDIYIYTSIDKYLEMPDLLKFIPDFIQINGLAISTILIEPKASGKSLKQLLHAQTNYNVVELQGDILSMSKIERARANSPYIEGGRVNLVEGNWVEGYLHQVSIFPNGKHDEHVDLTCYAIDRLLAKKTANVRSSSTTSFKQFY